MKALKVFSVGFISTFLCVCSVQATQIHVPPPQTVDFPNNVILNANVVNGSLGITVDTGSTVDPSQNGLTTVFDVFFQGSTSNYVAVFSTTGDGTTFPSATESLFVSTGTPDPGTGGAFDTSNTSYWTQDNNSSDTNSISGSISYPVNSDVQFQFNAQTTTDGGLLSLPSFLSISMATFGIVQSDPPISSGIFSLNADGSLSINPILGLDGDPVLQPASTIPEPSSFALLSSALAVFFCWKFRRTTASPA